MDKNYYIWIDHRSMLNVCLVLFSFLQLDFDRLYDEKRKSLTTHNDRCRAQALLDRWLCKCRRTMFDNEITCHHFHIIGRQVKQKKKQWQWQRRRTTREKRRRRRRRKEEKKIETNKRVKICMITLNTAKSTQDHLNNRLLISVIVSWISKVDQSNTIDCRLQRTMSSIVYGIVQWWSNRLLHSQVCH
jgi:hypothetical protein